MHTKINDRLLVWGADNIEPNTIEQAARTARLPFVHDHVALMPDAHLGVGSTVGSVVATEGAIIPSCCGVDLGCGMAAVQLNITADQLPDDMQKIHRLIEKAVPAGVGKGHETTSNPGMNWIEDHRDHSQLTLKQIMTAASQFGTLGSGNHFVEVDVDEQNNVWIVLHSGSRGIGNQLASGHIKLAKDLAKIAGQELEDPDLASLVQGTPEFDAYIRDMLWSQDYAAANRQEMLSNIMKTVLPALGAGMATHSIVNCHHNFTEQEWHDERWLWITRKGAIRADEGRLGIIPGSMGTSTYIVRGLGNPLSWNSCSHGAGRKMSRGEARRTFTEKDLQKAMKGKTWNIGQADKLIDEIPASYKDIEQVMASQSDLVVPVAKLTQVLNYKGA